MNNSEELSNLIQSIQSKLESTNNLENNQDKVHNNEIGSNENISMLLNGLLQNLGNNSNNNVNNNTNNNQIDIASILNNLSGNNNVSNSNNNGINLDINSISRMKNILSSVTREDPRKNLLHALKPFLSKSRQDKIGEYMTYLSIGSAIGIFGNSKGSEK